MSAPTLRVYSTPTCAPCRTAKRELDAAGIAYEAIDLTEDAAALADLKERLNAKIITTPMFERHGELLEGIAFLRGIIDSEKVAA